MVKVNFKFSLSRRCVLQILVPIFKLLPIRFVGHGVVFGELLWQTRRQKVVPLLILIKDQLFEVIWPNLVLIG